MFKVEGSNRWLMTLGLAQAGEFGFVLLSFAQTSYGCPSS
jgi:CPA2 family monovalent cation:H+ antiporter-2